MQQRSSGRDLNRDSVPTWHVLLTTWAQPSGFFMLKQTRPKHMTDIFFTTILLTVVIFDERQRSFPAMYVMTEPGKPRRDSFRTLTKCLLCASLTSP